MISESWPTGLSGHLKAIIRIRAKNIMLSYCQAVSQDVPVPGAGVPGGWSRGDQLGRDQLLSPDQLQLRTQACRPGVMSCNQTDAPQLNNSLLFLKAFHYCCKIEPVRVNEGQF